jgi:hypothetical protein
MAGSRNFPLSGRLDYAFNGGSGGASASATKMSEAAWRKTIDGYLTSMFLCRRAELRYQR